MMRSLFLSTQGHFPRGMDSHFDQRAEPIPDANRDAYFTLDSNFQILDTNAVFRNWTGMKDMNENRQPLEHFFSSDDRFRLVRHLQKILLSGKPEKFEEVYEGRILQWYAYLAKESVLAVFCRDVTPPSSLSQ